MHGEAWAEHAEADLVAAQAKVQGTPR
jgi:hypothetical protein